MRVKVTHVYLDCTSPACASGVLVAAEWDPSGGTVYWTFKGEEKAVSFARVREMTIAPVPAVEVEAVDYVAQGTSTSFKPALSVKVRKKQ